MVARICVLTFIASALAAGAAASSGQCVGNLGYNSYEGALSGGYGLHHYFGPGVGYPSPSGDYFRRYIPPEQWGQFGYGTGHLGEGYGPYIYANPNGGSPPSLFDPLPQPYEGAVPPSIKVRHGMIYVSIPSWVPGIRCVTVTILAFNGAELESRCISCPPYKVALPVLYGVKNVRVRIDYKNNQLSATSYPL